MLNILSVTPPATYLANLRSEFFLAEQRLVALRKEMKPGTPTYDNAKQRVDELDDKINRALDGILIGLQNGLQATKARVAELDERIESARNNDLRMAKLTRPYYEAKQDLANKIQFNQILAMKIASEKTDLALPRASPVTILEEAFPPERPVAPNRARGFSLICIGVAFAFAGFLMLKDRRTPSIPQPA